MKKIFITQLSALMLLTTMIFANPALTRTQLNTLIDTYMSNPTSENADKVINANTSEITDMSNLFRRGQDPRNYTFNLDISGWDVSNVINMQNMFSLYPRTTLFNQDISNWDVSNVTNMSNMFSGSKFNQDISNWDVSNVTNMNGMFSVMGVGHGGCNLTDFNQDISNWNVQKVTEHNRFTSECTNPYDGRSALIKEFEPEFDKIPEPNPETTKKGIIGGSQGSTAKNIPQQKTSDLLLTHTTSWHGIAQRYGWYTFNIEDEGSLYNITLKAPTTGSSWVGIYKDGSLVVSTWAEAGTSSTIHQNDFKAGTYKVFVNKSGNSIDTASLLISLFQPSAMSYDMMRNEVVGGKYSSNATYFEANPIWNANYLLLTHPTDYNGKPQRYGWYLLDITSPSTLKFQTSKTGSSWVGLQKDSKLVSSKWSPANTIGEIDVAPGKYKMFINTEAKEPQEMSSHGRYDAIIKIEEK